MLSFLKYLKPVLMAQKNIKLQGSDVGVHDVFRMMIILMIGMVLLFLW